MLGPLGLPLPALDCFVLACAFLFPFLHSQSYSWGTLRFVQAEGAPAGHCPHGKKLIFFTSSDPHRRQRRKDNERENNGQGRAKKRGRFLVKSFAGRAGPGRIFGGYYVGV